MQNENVNLHGLLLDYSCALRTHQLDDAALTDKLLELGLTPDEAELLIKEMDEMNWSAESNSHPTSIGWLSILVAVGVTGASGYYLSRVLAIPLGFVQVVFVLPFVALGFLAHVGCSRLLEGAGIRTSVATPIPIPDDKQLKDLLAEARTTPPEA